MVDSFRAKVECSIFSERHVSYIGVFYSKYGAQIYKYELPNLAGNESLYITKREDLGSFYLNGNLRKWYFGKEYPLKDLTYYDFVKALIIVSKRLEIPFSAIKNANLRYVELGANITLAKPYEVYIQGCFSYPKLAKDRTSFKENSVTFGKRGNQIIIYDKISEILRKGRNRELERLYRKVVVIRVERKYSNTLKSLDERINTFSSVMRNWNGLLDEWKGFFDEVKINPFVDSLPNIKPKSLYKTELINLLISNQIKIIGNEGLYYLTKKYCIPKKRSEYERDLIRICTSFQPSIYTYNKLKFRAEVKRNRLRKRKYLNN